MKNMKKIEDRRRSKQQEENIEEDRIEDEE